MGENPDDVATREEARTVIEEIARRKGTFTAAFRREAEDEAENGRKGMLQAIEGGEEIREDLAKALKIISTDLYTNRARFLMEVIQNADDCMFSTGDTPTVCITVLPTRVTVECNEVGFSTDNIRALCRTGRSTKAPGLGYTGEKGIGFKSVFKLAKRAHIRSPPYFFQLDQTRELGMITPQWDEEFFDDHVKEHKHQTTIVLDRICDNKTNFSTALEQEIDTIDPVLILFLRRIKRLHLTLFTSLSDAVPSISKCFRCVNWESHSGIVSLKDEDTARIRRLYKHQFRIDFKGNETRRPGITNTDVVLAFPIEKESGKFVPLIQNTNPTFAYLPLGKFGFKFVIQADFLTTSNRQSIDEDSCWNENIADAIPRAFEAAVSNFNGGGSDLAELAIKWPLYLDDASSRVSAYWRRISQSITKHLSGALVIKDRTGTARKPKQLRLLDGVHDRHGEPMFGQLCDYVAAEYPESVRDALLSLGVSASSWSWVCIKIHELHGEGSLRLKMRSKEWCSDLAKVILGERGNRVNELRHIPLIPLHDGTWRYAPSKDNPIYFPSSFGIAIPPGLPLSLVDLEACTCPKRRKLFELLGVKDCTIPNVVERIIDYHNNFKFAKASHFIAQLKYLYKMREHLRPGDMDKVYFEGSNSGSFLKGDCVYADISAGKELTQLFSGYNEASILDPLYFADLDSPERAKLADWLAKTADVALVPRFIGADRSGLHKDFKWLLLNKSDKVLTVLHQNWDFYKHSITGAVREALADHEFMCKTGCQAPLRETYIPLPELVEKAQAFGSADHCEFLVLPSGEPKNWAFLSDLGVGLDTGLDFHLWILRQLGFRCYNNVSKSQQLYYAIQWRAFSPSDEQKVRKAFAHQIVNLPNTKFQLIEDCVWHAPKGFSSRRTLSPVYGDGLNRLFQGILKVPNASCTEALRYLQTLRNNAATAMADVADVYVFLLEHCADSFNVDANSACIAIPASSGTALEWKTPAECVWDDDEFIRNGLELESKISIRSIMESYAPSAEAFFTKVLKLRNAGLEDLLNDLALMQGTKRDNPKRVYRIYERVDSFRRRERKQITKAFKATPIVFLRGMNGQCGQWVSIKDCVWTRSVLRNKHALMPSLNDYRGLFRDTLEVPNATIDMLVAEVLGSTVNAESDDEDRHHYVKELLQEIARLRPKKSELGRLVGKSCWPCRTATPLRRFCSIGSFYVNDRQDLFKIFDDSQIFLDFDFNSSRKLVDLLGKLGCDSFLSETVTTETEFCEPLQQDHGLTQDFRSRGNALVKYFEYMECDSPYELDPLLENVEVWTSDEIKTHYTLDSTTKTKRGGGSNVKVNIGEEQTPKLEIYVSANEHIRLCALVAEVPNQLVEALKLEPSNLPHVQAILQVPQTALATLLITKGITAGDAAENRDETLAVDLTGEDWQIQSDDSSTDDGDNTSLMSATVASESASSAVIETTSASAASGAINSSVRPSVHLRPSSRPATPRSDSHDLPDYLNGSGDQRSTERRATAHRSEISRYNESNRSLNMDRLRSFARSAHPTVSPRSRASGSQSAGSGNAFDMSTLRDTLQTTETPSVSISA